MDRMKSKRTSSSSVPQISLKLPDQIDSVFLRPGRLDRLIYIPLPGKASRLSIFKAALNKSLVAPEVKFLAFLAKSRDSPEGKLTIRDSIDSDIRRQWEKSAKERATGDGTQDESARGPCLTNHKVHRLLFHSLSQRALRGSDEVSM